MTTMIDHGSLESVKRVRRTLAKESRSPSFSKGLALFLFTFAGYAVSFAAFLLCQSIQARLFVAFSVFVFTSVLFLIGHDACHGSLTGNATLDKAIGRLSFLPSYHPYTAWEYTHNVLHHGMTNVRGRDPVFAPLSKAEYDSLPVAGRWIQRIYRTTLGLGLYYFVEVWWKLELFPSGRFRPLKNRRIQFQLDRLCVLGFAVAQCGLVIGFERTSIGHLCATLATDIVLPFALFNLNIGFIIFLHHTHPRIPWYGSAAEYSFFRSQVASCSHIQFPAVLHTFLLHIMDHTAHHVDARVPLYNLHAAQRQLEETYPTRIVVDVFSFRAWARIIRTCRLYDYERHIWLDFDGTQLAVVLERRLSS
jgi:omega-6 fatty acid desaturase (delta-12 desaturase)